MLSYYFKLKTQTEEFKTRLQAIIEEIKDKRVLLYGANNGFKKLDKEYGFTKKLNIVAVVDECLQGKATSKFCGIKSISREMLLREDFDVILVTDEASKPIVATLEAELALKKENIKAIFEETIPEESSNINYLHEQKFEKTLPKLVKKLKGKTVIFYGAGIYLETINKYFDLSGINAIGIVDQKFPAGNTKQTFMGLNAQHPFDLPALNPDYVIISTKFYINIFEYLHFDLLKSTNIKIQPLVKKSLLTLIKEILK